MRLVVDENLPPQLARALNLLGIDAQSHADLGWKGFDDEQWLPLLEGRAVLTSDANIARRKRTFAAMMAARVVLFVLPSSPDLAEHAMLVLLHRTALRRHVDEQQAKARGGSFRISRRTVNWFRG